MDSCFYLIHALTPLHPGAEGVNSGIVDNIVQRDPIQEIPVIHASGIKGSLSELFEEIIYPEEVIKTADNKKVRKANGIIEFIFGKNDDAKGNRTPNYYFFQADMICIPVRSNKRPFFNATSPEVLRQFLHQVAAFGNANLATWEALLKPIINTQPEKGAPKYFGEKENDLSIDDYAYQPQHTDLKLTNEHYDLLGKNIVVFQHDDFKAICRKLPVLARNYLVDGESKNLWYEEVVPRESRFYFHQFKPESDNKLEDGLKKNNNIFQVGGNASIGYGFCSLKKINA